MNTKNIAESTSLFHEVEEGIFVFQKENESTDYENVSQDIKQNFIQFHFCGRGAVNFV